MNKYLFILLSVFLFGIPNVKAQDDPMKIVTNHPDFKIKVQRCAASGKTVVIDMQFINQGPTDVENVSVICWAYGYSQSEAYDNEGNIYKEMSASVSGNSGANGNTPRFSILADVPMKVRLTIEGVSPSVESIARLKLCVNCEAWKLDSDKQVEIRNIPISRD